MRRFWIALTVVAVVMAMALPVTAKKPTVETVKVTLALVGEAGLTTNCNDGDGDNGYLLMTRDRAGLVGGPSDVVLGLFMNDAEWNRRYPEGSGTGFAGCHGETVDESPVSPSPFGGLGMNIDRNGAVTDILWHFDYYLDGTEIQLNPVKTRFVWTVREYFTLTGNDLEWDESTSTVSGWFYLRHSLYDTDTEIGYEPFPGSPEWMQFTVIIEEP